MRQGAATTIRILGKGKVTLEVLVVPRGFCWVLWPSQGVWLAETGMGFLFGPRTEPFVSGCKHELEGVLGVRVHCWQCLVKSKLVGMSGGHRIEGAWSSLDVTVGT